MLQADGCAAGLEGAFVGGFHDAGAAAGDDGEFRFGQQPAGFLGGFVISDRPGRVRAVPKMVTAVPDRRQGFEAFDELRHDAEDAPRRRSRGRRIVGPMLRCCSVRDGYCDDRISPDQFYNPSFFFFSSHSAVSRLFSVLSGWPVRIASISSRVRCIEPKL